VWPPLPQPPYVTNTTASAQRSADGSTLVVRLLNPGATATTFTLELEASANRWRGNADTFAATLWTLSADSLDAGNSAGTPTQVSPVRSSRTFRSGDALLLPPHCYAVLEISNMSLGMVTPD
jgi:hypothetical protein